MYAGRQAYNRGVTSGGGEGRVYYKRQVTVCITYQSVKCSSIIPLGVSHSDMNAEP